MIDTDPAGRQKGTWRGDNSSTASSFILVYDPNAIGRPGLTSVGTQIGRFQADGSVDRGSSRVGDAPSLLAESVVLNYLALHNEVGQLSTVLPMHGLGTTVAEIDSLTAFQGLANR